MSTDRVTYRVSPLPAIGRRVLLRSALALAAVIAASGHAPYGQWNVYRKRRLLILTSRSDGRSFPIGERVASVLAAHLPESQSQVSRAPSNERVASLISTHQMDVAVLSRNEAELLRAGSGPFEEYGAVPLRVMVALGEYLLVCRDDFPALHAYLVAKTLAENRVELGLEVSSINASQAASGKAVPMHRGAQAYFNGLPPPED